MLPSLNIEKTVDFLVGLLNTPSPTGDTNRAMAYISEQFAHLPFSMEMTPKGVLVGTWEGKCDDKPRALTAHTDTLGAMVMKIKHNGRLQFTNLGGLNYNSIEGEGVTIFASNGQKIRGSVLPFPASAHATPNEKRGQKRAYDTMEIRIDAITTSKRETEALGIRIGDIIAVDPRVEVGDAGYIRSRFLDDKVCVATLFGALDALHTAGLTPAQRTTVHIANYEEVGHGGASGLPDDLFELLALDMAVVAPMVTGDEHSVSICAKDSRGPYHLEFRRQLEALADTHKLPFHTDIYPFYGSDGGAYWRAGGGARVGLIGPGVDASHHYERTHISAIQATTKLITAYLLS